MNIVALYTMVSVCVARSHIVFQRHFEFAIDGQLIKLMDQPGQAVQCSSAFDQATELELHTVETTIVVGEISLPATLHRETFFLEVDLPTCHCGEAFRQVLSEQLPPTTERVVEGSWPTAAHPSVSSVSYLKQFLHLEKHDDKWMQMGLLPIQPSRHTQNEGCKQGNWNLASVTCSKKSAERSLTP